MFFTAPLGWVGVALLGDTANPTGFVPYVSLALGQAVFNGWVFYRCMRYFSRGKKTDNIDTRAGQRAAPDRPSD
jgi:hypothetical protein